MINITNKRARSLYHAEMIRTMERLENIQARELKSVLNRQYLNTAKLVQQGITDAVDHAVNQERRKLINLIFKNYKRAATVFSNKTFKVIENSKKLINIPEIKGPKDEFWAELNRWMTTQAASKVTGMQNTSKKLLANTIQKGMNEGLSNAEIAKNLRKTGQITTPIRARTIAITETHTAAVKSVDSAIKSTRIEMEKEWVANIDKRTRPAHVDADGQRISQDGDFVVGGVAMAYPGDPRGGGDNTIRCRCVLMYHSVKRIDELKPYEPEPGGFIPVINIKEAEERFSNLGVNYISKPGKGKTTWIKEDVYLDKILNPTLKEFERIEQNFPMLIAELKGDSIWDIEFFRGKFLPKEEINGRLGSIGAYFKNSRKIKIGITDNAFASNPSLQIGKRVNVVAKDIQSTIRHEVGHHYFDVIRKERSNFVKTWKELGENDYFKKNISIYAGTNVDEAFAECFSAYTSPIYKRGMLPKKIEKYFDILLK